MKTLKTLLQEITAGIKAWANASFSSGTHVHGNIANNGKLATASKVVISDSNKNITTSNVSDTELGYLSGVTSAIQTQISSKAYDADVVHTTGNETIAGTKTFASEIDGTASKAVADEDGNNIKTTYGKLASANTWTGSNTFTAPSVKSYTSIINDSMTLGTVPASTLYNGYFFKGSTSDLIGSVDLEWASNGTASIVTRLTRNTSGASREFAYSFSLPQTGNGIFRVYGDCLPGFSTFTYNLGSSSYQWSSVYAQTYYYNGTAWGLDKANVWTNTNTFSADSYGELIRLKNTGLDLSNGNPALSSAYNHLIWWDDKNNAHYAKLQAWTNDNTSAIVLTSYYRVDANTVRTSSLKNYCNASSKMFFPESNADTELGTSANKWKTLNGVNPGALSLPDLSSDGYVNLSGNISVNSQYTYTVPSDGWLCLYVQTSGFHAENVVAIFNGAGVTDAHRWANSAVSSINLLRLGVYHGAVSVPVRAGNTYFCYINVDSSTSLAQVFFYFYKATGNV